MKIEMTSNNSRKPWIDALRGFAMLLVIIMHVPFAAGVGGENVYTTLIGWMFMPLFFFVSGLVMYNPNRQWSAKTWCTYMGRKFMQLIVPTSIVFLLLCWVYRYNVLEQLLHPMKAGCWFTITLFGFILLYTFYEWIIRVIKVRDIWKNILLLIITSALSCVVAKFALWKGVFGENIRVYYDALQISKWCYFQYFILGVLVSKYQKWIKKVIAYPMLLAFTFIVWIVVAITCMQDLVVAFPIPYLNQLISVIYVYVSIMLVTYVFYHYRDRIATSKFGQIVQVVGCNTLGIYLLHYFFLWGGYNFILKFYSTHPTPLMMFVIYVSVAILILAASMLLISVIKVSPILSHLILGKK
jgi:fucose 4-O-acetylase-like acetyltransferase